jgi:hypothetical protein
MIKLSLKRIVFVVLTLVGISVLLIKMFNDSTRESFVANDVIKINQGLNSVIACKKTKCDATKIRNFGEFQKILGYPKFDVLLFLKLLNLRQQQTTDLTSDQISKVVKDGNFVF